MDEYQIFLKTVSNNAKRMRMESMKTTEEVAIEALGQGSTSFLNQAENLKNGKHFNLKHLFLLSRYYCCGIEDFFK